MVVVPTLLRPGKPSPGFALRQLRQHRVRYFHTMLWNLPFWHRHLRFWDYSSSSRIQAFRRLRQVLQVFVIIITFGWAGKFTSSRTLSPPSLPRGKSLPTTKGSFTPLCALACFATFCALPLCHRASSHPASSEWACARRSPPTLGKAQPTHVLQINLRPTEALQNEDQRMPQEGRLLPLICAKQCEEKTGHVIAFSSGSYRYITA